jgi:hypothetical protein
MRNLNIKKQASLDDPINTTSGIKAPKVNVSSDTIVNTDVGYPIRVNKNSAYAQQAKDTGSVVNNLRPGTYTKATDPLAVGNEKVKDSLRMVQHRKDTTFKRRK